MAPREKFIVWLCGLHRESRPLRVSQLVSNRRLDHPFFIYSSDASDSDVEDSRFGLKVLP